MEGSSLKLPRVEGITIHFYLSILIVVEMLDQDENAAVFANLWELMTKSWFLSWILEMMVGYDLFLTYIFMQIFWWDSSLTLF